MAASTAVWKGSIADNSPSRSSIASILTASRSRRQIRWRTLLARDNCEGGGSLARVRDGARSPEASDDVCRVRFVERRRLAALKRHQSVRA